MGALAYLVLSVVAGQGNGMYGTGTMGGVGPVNGVWELSVPLADLNVYRFRLAGPPGLQINAVFVRDRVTLATHAYIGAFNAGPIDPDPTGGIFAQYPTYHWWSNWNSAVYENAELFVSCRNPPGVDDAIKPDLYGVYEYYDPGPADPPDDPGTGSPGCSSLTVQCSCADPASFAGHWTCPLPSVESFTGPFHARAVSVSSAVGGSVLAVGSARTAGASLGALGQYCVGYGAPFVVDLNGVSVRDFYFGWRWARDGCVGVKRIGESVVVSLERLDNTTGAWVLVDQLTGTFGSFQAGVSAGYGIDTPVACNYGGTSGAPGCLTLGSLSYERGSCFRLPVGVSTLRVRLTFWGGSGSVGYPDGAVNVDDVVLCRLLSPCSDDPAPSTGHCCNCCCSQCEASGAPTGSRPVVSPSSLSTGPSFSPNWAVPSQVGTRDTGLTLPLASLNVGGRQVFASSSVASISLDRLRSDITGVEAFRVGVRGSLVVLLGFGLVFTVAKDLARD
jgi:hypothetical protein